jgi:AcrR family transcriptional regulator
MADMGNREDLLAGAKRCLYEKGYARTTARDIASASGVSLAAIGYHFGSKEALLNLALYQATDEWGAELGAALADGAGTGPGSFERFESAWDRVIELFTEHRPLWAAQFEIFAQVEQAPELQKFFADANQEARFGLANLFQGIDSAEDPENAQVVGSFYQALLTGVIAQLLIDPERAPSGKDLAQALRTITSPA